MWKDGKYLLAYLSPAAAWMGLYLGGAWSFGAAYLAFIIIPLLELVLPARKDNVPADRATARSHRVLFDWLLYFNVPIVYGLIVCFVYRLATDPTLLEIIGYTYSIGVIFGSLAINVAHELGHREKPFERWLSRLLLVPPLYTHFTIEHNYGHHKYVATPEDPATARRGQSIYAFWVRSVFGSFRNALKLERLRLEQRGGGVNMLYVGFVMQFVYLSLVFWFGGWLALGCAVYAAVIGFLLLESVNYIEHYGLVRQKLASGRYAPVEPKHSWNSNHELGRIFLYELTRHPDHHYKSTRKYQILRHLDDAPQLPVGYPASIILAFVPPLWKNVMDPRIPPT